MAMLEWLVPNTIRESRGYLGLIEYYRRFIAGYATMAGPLTELSKKGQFCWTAEVKAAFMKLKKIMTTAQILVMPNFT